MNNVTVQAVEPLRMQSHALGAGEAVVLVGGGLTGWVSWEPHATRLSETRQAVRLQLISVQYGLEDRPLPAAYSVEIESRAMAATLDALEMRRPVDLVAWSYGALVTLDFALDHPDRVRTLTLIEPPAVWVLPNYGRDESDVRAQRSTAPGPSDEITAAHLRAFVCGVGLCPPGRDPEELPQWPVWMQHRRSLRNIRAAFDHMDDLTRLRAFSRPVLLVTGTGTAPFLRDIHQVLARELPMARATEMPAGHAPHLVSMDRFLDELAAFQASAQRTEP